MEETDTDGLLLEIEDEQEALGKVFKALRDGQDVIYHPEWVEHYNIKLAILKWNVERNNFGFNLDNEIAMLNEEASEAEDTDDINEFVDGRADEFVVMTGTLAKSGLVGIQFNDELVAWYNRYINIPRELEANGYNFEKVMKEVLKEINSRKQDSEQKKKWETDGIPLGEKWKKSKTQEPSTLYKADFSRCKL